MSINLSNIFLIIGAIFLIISVKYFLSTKKFLGNSSTFKATVIENKEIRRGRGNGISYKPIFSYNNSTNQKQIFESPVNSYPATYKLGESVKIRVSKSDRKLIKIESFWGLFRWSVLFLALASPFLSIGITYHLYEYFNR